MADQRQALTPSVPMQGDLERRRGRQLRSEQVRSRREQEEQAIAALDDSKDEQVLPSEVTSEQPEQQSEPTPRPEQPAARPAAYQPFPEDAPQSSPDAAATDQSPADQSDEDRQRGDSVSDRIRSLRQAKNFTKGVEQAQSGATSLREAVQVAKAAENIAGASRAAAGASRVVAFLNIPIGPLPLWAWLLILLGIIIAIALVWLGLVVVAAVACEDPHVAWIPDAIKNVLAKLVVGLPCPGGTG